MMKLSAKCMLLSVSALSLPALAQEGGSGFDNFLLSSPSIISPSQYYQVKGGRFEALAGLQSGTFEFKTSGTEADSSSQVLAAGYAQALTNQFVLAADVLFIQSSVDSGSGDSESSGTAIAPKLAFSISPVFSLGAGINIISGEADVLGGSSESYSYNTFIVGGTLHQEAWEATLALTTAHEDEDSVALNSAQTISLHGRYKIMPVLALGVTFEQADYPGVEKSNQTLETETSYGLVLESAVSDNSRVEAGFKSVANSFGEDGADETEIFLGGGFNLSPNLELGGQLRFLSAESDTSSSSDNTYALTLSLVN